MKPSLLATLLIAALLIAAACHKATAPIENETIVGKWKLTESLMDPGDGSGKWQAADLAHPQYLEFKADGSVVATLGAPTGYKLTSDSTMLLITKGDSLPNRYTLTKTKLTLLPPCYEPCGMHYQAVK